ncbi:MAG: hypothetical protein PHP83_03295 [Clostridia bacterium]|nr:hypothetical protein [Clostridia bacterium]
MTKLTTEEFENKCMDIMEAIITISRDLDRNGAVDLSKKMLARAEEDGNDEVTRVYKKVVEEFENATDEEYETLKKQLL